MSDGKDSFAFSRTALAPLTDCMALASAVRLIMKPAALLPPSLDVTL